MEEAETFGKETHLRLVSFLPDSITPVLDTIFQNPDELQPNFLIPKNHWPQLTGSSI